MFEQCRKTGVHVVRTRRLLIVSARALDYWRHYELGDDPQARHWHGLREEHLRPKLAWPLVAHQPIRDGRGVLFPYRNLLVFTAVDRRTLRIVGGIDIHRHGPEYMLSALMGQGYRDQGYGAEFISGVLRLAHRHFGIARVLAGYEDGNVVSQRWLEKAGFLPTTGPDTYTLDNGRVARSKWCEHIDRGAVLKCPWLTEDGRARVRARVPVSPAPDDFAGQMNATLWQDEQEDTGDSCRRCPAPVA